MQHLRGTVQHGAHGGIDGNGHGDYHHDRCADVHVPGLQMGMAIVIALTLSVPGLAYLIHNGLDLSSIGGMSFAGIAFDPVWRGVVTPMTIVGPVMTLVLIVSLSVLYPAVKAARISPIDAMRHR